MVLQKTVGQGMALGEPSDLGKQETEGIRVVSREIKLATVRRLGWFGWAWVRGSRVERMR